MVSVVLVGESVSSVEGGCLRGEGGDMFVLA